MSTTIHVGDDVLIRDWRTGEPFGVWSRVTRLMVHGTVTQCVTESENRSAHLVIATLDHSWTIPRGQWSRDVLGVRPKEGRR